MERDLRRRAESRAMALQQKVDEDVEVVRSLWADLSDVVRRRLSAENVCQARKGARPCAKDPSD